MSFHPHTVHKIPPFFFFSWVTEPNTDTFPAFIRRNKLTNDLSSCFYLPPCFWSFQQNPQSYEDPEIALGTISNTQGRSGISLGSHLTYLDIWAQLQLEALRFQEKIWKVFSEFATPQKKLHLESLIPENGQLHGSLTRMSLSCRGGGTLTFSVPLRHLPVSPERQTKKRFYRRLLDPSARCIILPRG